MVTHQEKGSIPQRKGKASQLQHTVSWSNLEQPENRCRWAYRGSFDATPSASELDMWAPKWSLPALCCWCYYTILSFCFNIFYHRCSWGEKGDWSLLSQLPCQPYLFPLLINPPPLCLNTGAWFLPRICTCVLAFCLLLRFCSLFVLPSRSCL